MQVQVQQREEVWRFDRIKDHDTVSVVAWPWTRSTINEMPSVGDSREEVSIDAECRLAKLLAVPSDDRCSRPSRVALRVSTRFQHLARQHSTPNGFLNSLRGRSCPARFSHEA